MNTNFKKFIAVLSASAMLSALAAPCVLADDADETVNNEITEVSEPQTAEVPSAEAETAELSDADEEGSAELLDGAFYTMNFDDVPAGVLVSLGTTSTDIYTGIAGLNFKVGSRSGGGEAATKAEIVASKGTDGSNALLLNNSRYANSGRGPHFTVDAPSTTDMYKISMNVMPDAAGTQALGIGTMDAAGTNYALTMGEWNTVELYISKVDGEFALAINGSVTTKGTLSDTPAFYGNNAENSGAIYFDDIVMTAITEIPDVDPTPTPVPAYVGYTNDFESAMAETLIYMTVESTVPYKGFGGSVLYVTNRPNGAVPDNRWSVVSSGGNPGKAIQLNSAGTADSSRSARAELIAPKDAAQYGNRYKVSFDVLPGASQDLYIGDSTSSHGGAALNLEKSWQTVTIYMFDGVRVVMVGDRFGCMSATSSLPVLWGMNANNAGTMTFDNYAISEVTEEEIANAISQSIDIADENKTVYKDGDVYKFINTFALPETSCGENVSWKIEEKTGDGTAPTSDLTIAKSKLNVLNRDPEKTYVLTATTNKYDITKEKVFELKSVPTQDMLAEAAATIDLSKGTDVELRSTDEDGTVNYTVRSNFVVPTTAGQASVAWSLKDPADSKYVAFDDDTVKMTFSDAATVTIVATLSYAGDTYEREFKLVLDNQYNNIVAKVGAAMTTAVVYPAGNEGDLIDPITLSETERTLISTDIAYKTAISSDVVCSYSVPDEEDRVYMSNEGVISVEDKDAHNITLRRTVSYVSDGKTVYSESKDYPITVQFDPEKVDETAVVKANAYADLKVETAKKENENITESRLERVRTDAFNSAMTILSNAYKVRFDAVYDGNFDEIPDSVDDDFDLPTEGYFGSTITWGSSDTSIKINDGTAKVTQPSSDKTVQLKATFTAGAAANANAYSTKVEVTGTGKKSSGGGGGGSSSGGGNSYRGSLGTSAYVNAPTAAPVAPNASTVNNETVNIQSKFKDLLDVPWAAEAIEALAAKGVVSGKDDTRFAPNDNITRAELSKIIVGAFGIGTGAAPSFSDVAADAWYAAFVGACADAGIVTGYEDGTFRPDNLVTRQEMAVMIKRAADFKGVAIDTPNAKADFTDAASIADYAADSIETLQRAGMINGLEDGSFAPKATATRAQAAKILYNFAK